MTREPWTISPIRLYNKLFPGRLMRSLAEEILPDLGTPGQAPRPKERRAPTGAAPAASHPARTPLALSPETSDRLVRFCAEAEVSPGTLLLAAYQALLHRHALQGQIGVVGPGEMPVVALVRA